MPMQNNLRIIFYEPSGRGGISQYTYQLAESLACKGSDVSVITTENNEDFKFYSDLIDHISHNDDIICVNEYIPLEKINFYFLASDLVVLPYIKTYTSGVLLAAYAAGRSAVVTDTGALSEVVEVGKSGFIVPP